MAMTTFAASATTIVRALSLLSIRCSAARERRCGGRSISSGRRTRVLGTHNKTARGRERGQRGAADHRDAERMDERLGDGARDPLALIGRQVGRRRALGESSGVATSSPCA